MSMRTVLHKLKQDTQRTYNVTLRRVRATIVAVEKRRVLHSLIVFLALGIQHAMRKRYIVMCGLSRSKIFFRIFSCTARFSEKKNTEHKMRILIFSKTFVRNISHSKNKWARYDKKMYTGLQEKCLLFLSNFNETWIFKTDFRKILKYQISWKSAQWEPNCCMRTDGQTWRS